MTLNIVFDISPSLKAFLEAHMPSIDDFNAKFDSLSANLNSIQVEIADLKAQLAAGGLTAEQEQAIFDRLATVTDAANAIVNPPAPPSA